MLPWLHLRYYEERQSSQARLPGMRISDYGRVFIFWRQQDWMIMAVVSCRMTMSLKLRGQVTWSYWKDSATSTILPVSFSSGKISRIYFRVDKSKHLISWSSEIKYPNSGSYSYLFVNYLHSYQKSAQSSLIYFILLFNYLALQNWLKNPKQQNKIYNYYHIHNKPSLQKLKNLSQTTNLKKQLFFIKMTVLIGYSSVFGTSASYSEKLQKQLQKNDIECLCGEIDSFGFEWMESFNGIVILLLSTTGNGECPANAMKFYKALKQRKQKKLGLENIKFSILGFGSTVYPKFCGFSKQIQNLLNELGAIQINKIQYCDSNLKADLNNEKLTKQIFTKWKKEIVSKIKSQIKNMTKIKQLMKNMRNYKSVGNQINMKKDIKNYNNQKDQINQFNEFNQSCPSLKKLLQIKRLKNVDQNLVSKIKIINLIKQYQSLPTAKIISIKQLRSKTQPNQDQERSTLHIKLQKDPHIKLTPGCVINVYPQNTIDKLKIITFLNETEQHQLIKQIIKRVKLNQPATRQLINIVFNQEQNFNHFTKQQKLLKYKQCLVNKNLTVGDLINEFKPKTLNFYAKLNLQPPRSYSLCSWHDNETIMELCVSIIPQGITSQFFQSGPQSLKFNVLSSGYKTVSQNQIDPMMMICNGTGIAPFRSLVQFYAEKIKNINQDQPLIKLYFGIQNQNKDFYFEKEWLEYQKKRLVDIKIAESRRNPQEKEYIQKILQPGVIYEHLIMKKGLVYICGSSGMAQGVKNVILQSIGRDTKNKEEINSLYEDLKQKSAIVEEIFH